MNSEWIETTLGEIATLQRGHDLPTQNRKAGDVPIMGSFGITGYHNEAKVNGPGVVIGRSGGSMGVVSYIDRDYWPLNTVLFVKDFNGNDERFVYYLLKTINFQAFNTGSAQASLNRNYVHPIKVTIPKDVNEQRHIAKVLSDLEDKIELDHQIKRTLEQIAQAIFKSWFVDFEPVKAKIGAKQNGQDLERAAMRAISGKTDEQLDQLSADQRQQLAATAALFPDELEESELGPIPKRWGARRIDGILELTYGKALKKSDRKPGHVPVYGSGGLNGFHNEHLVEGPGIIVGRKGTVGSLHWEDDNFFPIDTVFYVVPKEGFSLVYILYLLQTLGLETMNTDAAVPGLNRNNVYRLVVPFHPVELVAAYTDIMGSFTDKMSLNKNNTNTLVELRDSLLPKLLSGQIEIDAA